MFKVGDKVRIKDNLVAGRHYGTCRYVDDMKPFVGKVMEIIETDGKDYILKGMESFWFSGEMLKTVGKRKVIITTYGEELVLKVYEDDKMVAEGEKKVSIGDATKFSEKVTTAFRELKEVKYYNGRIVATKDSKGITKGKIYRVNQGRFKDDTDKYRPVYTKAVSFEDLNNMFNDTSYFIEIVE